MINNYGADDHRSCSHWQQWNVHRSSEKATRLAIILNVLIKKAGVSEGGLESEVMRTDLFQKLPLAAEIPKRWRRRFGN
jgi:hypothetical protein